jgi:hypothetical protein
MQGVGNRLLGEESVSETCSLEQRLAAVELAVRELQHRLDHATPAPNWLEQVTGSFKDEPAFAEVLEYGRALRQADRPPEDGGT